MITNKVGKSWIRIEKLYSPYCDIDNTNKESKQQYSIKITSAMVSKRTEYRGNPRKCRLWIFRRHVCKIFRVCSRQNKRNEGDENQSSGTSKGEGMRQRETTEWQNELQEWNNTANAAGKTWKSAGTIKCQRAIREFTRDSFQFASFVDRDCTSRM